MQNSKEITTFLNDDYSEAALYLNFRSTPSLIDGLKNSHRKIIYTIRKQNIKDRVKVSQLGPRVADFSQYLHGEVSLMGAIVTLAQNYTGSNNIPLLVPDGNFGTRQTPEASAGRYIYTYPEKYFDTIFKKEDDINLVSQMFEGSEIEPRFYVPTIPLLLVNGCIGIGVGFATKILSRNLDKIIDAIELTLNKKRVSKEHFMPFWNGFRGKIEALGNNKYKISGTAEQLTKKKILITELPITYDLEGYIKILRSLKDKGIIAKFTDLSENDIFKFEILLSPEEANKPFDEIFEDLKLSVNITESLTALDENNAIVEFNSPQEIFDDYFKIKIQFLEKRIKSEIDRLSKELAILTETRNFIDEVIKGTINLKDKRANIKKIMESKGYTMINKLLAMPLYSITKEEAEEIRNRVIAKEKELETMKHQTPENLWKQDLSSLKKALKEAKQ